MPLTNTTLRGEGYLLGATAVLECCGGNSRVLFGELGEGSALFVQEHALWCSVAVAPLDGYLTLADVIERLTEAHKRASEQPELPFGPRGRQRHPS